MMRTDCCVCCTEGLQVLVLVLKQQLDRVRVNLDYDRGTVVIL